MNGIDSGTDFHGSLAEVRGCGDAELATRDVQRAFEICRIHREIAADIRETDIHRTCSEQGALNLAALTGVHGQRLAGLDGQTVLEGGNLRGGVVVEDVDCCIARDGDR